MAVRKKLNHDDKTREKIRTSQLLNRLMDHVDGKVELSQTQVRGIEILLKKSLPDLQSIEVTGDLQTTPAQITDTPMTTDDWEKQYAANLESTSRPPESLN